MACASKKVFFQDGSETPPPTLQRESKSLRATLQAARQNRESKSLRATLQAAQQNTENQQEDLPFFISEENLETVFKGDKVAESAFLTALKSCPSFEKIAKSGGQVAIPAGLGKKEGNCVFSFYPFGKNDDRRIVMYVDENNKFHFLAFTKHNNQYSKEIDKAEKAAQKAKSRKQTNNSLTPKNKGR